MKRFAVFGLAVLLVGGWAARAQSPDDQFIRLYNVVAAADALMESGQPRAAQERYLEAQAMLQRLQTNYPYWNEKIVNFRRKYIAEKLSLLGPLPAPTITAPAAPAAAAAPAAPSPEPAALAALNEELRTLKAEREVLQAKLREALTAQPAAVDPRELVKAEARIKELEKEKELLKVDVSQRQEKPKPGTGKAELAEAQNALKEARQTLGRQTNLVASLTKEKQDLELRLKKLTGQAETKARKEAAKEAAKAPKGPSPEVAKLTLQMETQVKDLTQKLKSAQEELAGQRSKGEALAAEKTALEKRLAELASARAKPAPASPPAAAAPVPVPVPSPAPAPVAKEEPAPSKAAQAAENKQIKKLLAEREGLRKQVALLSRQLEDRKKRKGAGTADQLAEQLEILRARVEVYEARKVPYSPEEMALMKTGPLAGPRKDLEDEIATSSRKKAGRDLPAGAAALMAEAQRAFDTRRFEDAEAKYQQALKLDEQNVTMLTDLAATQMELNHLDQAEATIKRALAQDANHARALSLLGLVRFRQNRNEEALDVLSRSAQANPDDAVTQNFLGIALSQKGLRAEAETAFRKAIQLQPGYASAHHNLAVSYAAHQPPSLELARWHYQRATAMGHPKNAELEKVLETDRK